MSELFRRISRDLGKLGYSVLERRPNHVSLAQETTESIRKKIDCGLSSLEPDKVMVQVEIQVRDITPDRPWRIGVIREVGPNGTYPLGSHRAGGWPIKDYELFIGEIRQHAFSWLDRYSDENELIALLEELVVTGEAFDVPKASGRGWMDELKMAVGLAAKEAKREVIHPPIYLMMLASLYFRRGDRPKAAHHIRLWMKNLFDEREIEQWRNLLQQVERAS